ncbi:InlB B-repeat-containing protein [Ligaoa zhengdingensis]|uniref:InlB B-repeat-containing protein n=3 Tax=Ligaoa zhengdingensis TaxID=2763658 RepID=UPI0031BB1E60
MRRLNRIVSLVLSIVLAFSQFSVLVYANDTGMNAGWAISPRIESETHQENNEELVTDSKAENRPEAPPAIEGGSDSKEEDRSDDPGNQPTPECTCEVSEGESHTEDCPLYVGPFEASATVEGVIVEVKADTGVLPAGVCMEVRAIVDEGEAAQIRETIEGQLDGGRVIRRINSYDISFWSYGEKAHSTDCASLSGENCNCGSQSGKTLEIQPDNAKGSVTVTFREIEAEDPEMLEVFHVDAQVESAETMEITAQADAVVFQAPHFSTYALVELENAFEAGNGSRATPYEIKTVEQLENLSALVAAGTTFEYKYFKLTSDLDLSGVCHPAGPGVEEKSWNPIGTSAFQGGDWEPWDPTKGFGGYFDGDGHSVTELYINRPEEDFQGLFGYVHSNGWIQNLSVSGTVTGKDYVGAIAGFYYAYGNAKNCYAESKVSGHDSVGGLFGQCTGIIDSCGGDIEVRGRQLVGGLAGYGRNGAQSSFSQGIVSGESSVGGLIGGSEDSATIKNCYSIAEVSTTGEAPLAGGLVGGDANPKIQYSFYYCESTRMGVAPSTHTGALTEAMYLSDSELEGARGSATDADAFRYGEAIWRLNGGAKFSGIWEQGARYPQLASGATPSQTYRVRLIPYTPETSAPVTFTNVDENIKILPYDGGQQVYVPSAGIKLELAGVSEAVVFEPADAVEKDPVTGVYSITVSGNVDIVYYVEEDLTKPSTAWYSDLGAEFTLVRLSQLQGLPILVNSGESMSNKTIILGDDMDLTGIQWTPIGTEDAPFSGTFNANHKTISGLTVASEDGYAGLFGYTSGAKIYDLTVTGRVSGGANGGDYVGGIVGYMEKGSLYNSTFGSEAEPGSVSGHDYVGGLVGHSTGSIAAQSDSTAVSHAAVTGRDYVGGIVGAMTTGIATSSKAAVKNLGKVSGRTYVGGIVGRTTGSLATSGSSMAVNDADVEGTSYVGGLVGESTSTVGGSSSIVQNNGTVTATGMRVGGIAGSSSGSIGNQSGGTLENHGAVSGGQSTGGIVGYTQSNVYRGVSEAAVTGTSQVGGIAGYNAGTIAYCRTMVKPEGEDNTLGGLAGFNAGTIKNSYSYHSGALDVCGSASTGEVRNSFYLADASIENAFGEAKAAGEFNKNSTLYALNLDETAHRNYWAAGDEGYPLLGKDGTALYRVRLLPYTEGTDRGLVAFAASNTVPPEGDSIYVEKGSKVVLELQDTQGLFLVLDSVVTPEGASYEVTVNKDIDVVFGLGSDLNDGTAWYLDNPGLTAYAIFSENQLKGLAKLVNGTAVDKAGNAHGAVNFSGITITLGADIDLGGTAWIPIGDEEHPFAGIFQGGGKRISGLLVDSKEDYQGLFGYSTGKISDLDVTGSVTGADYVGGIVGRTTAPLDNCTFGEEAGTSSVSGRSYVGGIVGYVTGSLASSNASELVNHASVTALGDYVGGIAGYSSGGAGAGSGSVLRNTASIRGAGSVGGIMGNAWYQGYGGTSLGAGQKSIVENTGSVTGSADCVGGIVGQTGGQIGNGRQCVVHNTGVVAGKQNVGGIVGLSTYADANANAAVSRGWNSGAVSGVQNVGGIAGSASRLVKSSWNEASVTGSSVVGAILGDGPLVSFSYSTVPMTLLGDDEGMVSDSYYCAATEVPGAKGEAKTPEVCLSGEVAWLLDGGDAIRTNNWTQDDTASGPRLAISDSDKSVIRYQVTLDAVLPGASAVLEADAGKYLTMETDGVGAATTQGARQWVYLWHGNEIRLVVTTPADGTHVLMPEQNTLEVAGQVTTYTIVPTASKPTLSCRFGTEGIVPDYSWYVKDDGTLMPDPYTITTAAQLFGLARLVNGTATKDDLHMPEADGTAAPAVNFEEKTIQLGGDIDLASAAWTAIGSKTAPFAGTFDGKDFRIRGLNVAGSTTAESTTNYLGLLGYVSGATIRNVTVTGMVTNPKQYTGGIAGYAAEGSSFENCVFGDSTGALVSKLVCGNQGGGIVGSIASSADKPTTLKNCANYAEISGASNAAGIVGSTSGNGAAISDCQNSGTVTGSSNVAGIVGSASGDGVALSGCQNNGTVTGSSNIAGIAGSISGDKKEIIGCVNIGNITASGNTAAGIAAYLTAGGTISLSMNEGWIKASQQVGGIVGSMTNGEGKVTHCYNAGTIEGTTTSLESNGVGGIMGGGNSDSSVTYCHNYGDIRAAAPHYVGAITGKSFKENANNFYLEGCMGYNRPADASYAIAATAEQFASGEIAYRLDNGKSLLRTRHWSQGKDYPVFVDETKGLKPVYRLMSGSVSEGGWVRVPEYVQAGSRVQITVDRITGQILKLLSITGTSGETVNSESETGLKEGGVFEFIMDAFDMIYNALFASKPAAGSQFTVTFDSNGGTEVSPATVDGGKKVSEPSVPTKAGEDFVGWTLDGERYDFNTAVTGNITLTAQWKTTDALRVRFDTNRGGAAGSRAPADQYVTDEDLLTRPDNPTWEDEKLEGSVITSYQFLGWYTAAVGGKRWDFDQDKMGSTEMTLYAQWKEEDAFSSGTRTDPYEISSEDVLAKLAERVNEEERTYEDCYFLLTKDLTLTDWTPIGKFGKGYFAGNLDGGNHEIDLTINAKADYQGLFGYAVGATIENMTIHADITGRGGVAGVAGLLRNGTLRNITVTGSITGDKAVGGLVGGNSGNNIIGTLINCHNEAEIYSSGYSAEAVSWSGYSYVGGLVGWGGATATGCTNSGDVTGPGACVGGFFGWANKHIITDSHNSGNITGQGGYVGGLIGQGGTADSRIEDCTNSGTIDGGSGFTGGSSGGIIIRCTNSGRIIGGAGIGDGVTIIQDCTNTGEVTGTNAAGISTRTEAAGCTNSGVVTGTSSAYGITQSGAATGCTNTGAVTATAGSAAGITSGAATDCSNSGAIKGSTAVGGVTSGGSATRCYNTGTVAGGKNVGGITGNGASAVITNCYNLGEITGSSCVGGISGYLGTVTGSFSYVPTQALSITGAGGTVTNSYYLANSAASGASGTPANAAAFVSGEAAWGIDGGEGAHQNVWTQGSAYPVYGAPSYYRVSAGEPENGTLRVNNSSVVYAPAGTRVSVTAEADKDFRLKGLFVIYAGGETQTISDSMTMRTENAVVTASFEEKETGGGGGNDGHGGNGASTGTGSYTGAGNGSGDAEQAGGLPEGTNDAVAEGAETAPAAAEEAEPVEEAVEAFAPQEDEAAAMGGSAASGTDEDADPGEKEQKVFEIIVQTLKSNPLLVASILILLFLILGVAGFKRYRNYKKSEK